VKESEGKRKEERWREIKMLQERKLLFDERKLMWDQEPKIMFCDVSTLEPDVRTYGLAMGAQIAASKVASLNTSGASSDFGGTSGASTDFGGGGGYDGEIGATNGNDGELSPI